MEFNGLLTSTVFLPLVGACTILLLIKGDRNIRLFATLIAFADLVLAIAVFSSFDHDLGANRFQMIDEFGWIGVGTIFGNKTLEASYRLGVDGLSAPLVLLSGLIGFCAIMASFTIKHRVKEYFICILVLQTAVLGVFTALDFLMFFLFWELELVPMYLLISIWGTGRKEYSAMKFLIFTILGSAFMLVGIIAVFLAPTNGTFDMTLLSTSGINASDAIMPISMIFWFFVIAFAIKLPIWPVHTWLPDAHTDAPTAVSMILAGVLLKMGGYGLIRVSLGMFPELEHVTTFAWILAILSVISILYGALVTLRQTDLKRLIAYSSVSHMGLVMLGIAVGMTGGKYADVAISGANMQMLAHGSIAGLLFLMVGLVYERTHTRYIPELGGIANRMPFITVAFVIAGLASLGLPGLSGFVAEILVFLGAFKTFTWLTVLAATGIILAAGYILWMIERVLFGPEGKHFTNLKDSTLVESIPIAALIVSIVGIGIYPSLVIDVFDAGSNAMIQAIQLVRVGQ